MRPELPALVSCSISQGGEGSIWRHLATIAILGHSPMHPKTAMAARWHQIKPSLLTLSSISYPTLKIPKTLLIVQLEKL